MDGLNLSWETLEGLAKHNGPVTHPGWAMRALDAAFPLDLASWPSLEAQVAAISDDIAYDNHDIDDGLRAGLLSLDQLLSVPLVRDGWGRVRARYPGVARDRLLRELVRDQIGLMVNDVIAATRDAVARAGIASIDDVRQAGRALAGFGAEMAAAERSLKAFLYAELYHHPQQVAASRRAGVVVGGLFAAYRAEPGLMNEGWPEALSAAEPERSRHIADFIAGMTDRYAERAYRAIHGPEAADASGELGDYL